MKKMKIWNRALALVLSAGMALAPAASVLTCSMPVYAEKGADSDETGSEAKDDKTTDGTSDKTTEPKDDTDSDETKNDNTVAGDNTPKDTDSNGSKQGNADQNDNTNQTRAIGNTEYKNLKAILVYAEGDASLKVAPGQDANAMKATLSGTDQFSENDIETFAIPQNSNTDYKTKLWQEIDKIKNTATADSISVFYYSGHGGRTTDGTSYLALSGVNNITATELKSHLKEIPGKVVVILDACFSGGMAMPTSGTGGTFLDNFIGTFYSGDGDTGIMTGDGDDVDSGIMTADGNGGSTTSSSSYKFYFISAASSIETALQMNAGEAYQGWGELTASLGHALGYDRNAKEAYNVHAADTSSLTAGSNWSGYQGDGKITMRELAEYYGEVPVSNGEISEYCGGIALSSTPMIYPDTDNTVLFTYTKGTPATFRSYITNATNNVTVDSAGNVTINVTVENLTNAQMSISAAAYGFDYRNHIYTAKTNFRTTDEVSENETVYSPWEDADGQTQCALIGPGTSTFDVTIKSQSFLNVHADGENSYNPFCLKVYDYGNDKREEGATIRSYNALNFYTSTSSSTTDRGTIDTNALSLRKPAQLTQTTAGGSPVVYKTSSILPVEIYYDDNTRNKETNAACRLFVSAYDMGTDGSLLNGIHLDSDDAGKLLNSNGGEITLSGSNKISLINNDYVRPGHSKNTEEKRGSIYTDLVDTTGLTEGHYYILEVQCVYDATSETGSSVSKKVYTIIQRTTEEEADTYQIPLYSFDSKSSLGEPSKLYIPVGDGWANSVAASKWSTKDGKYWTAKGAKTLLQTTLDNDGHGLYTNEVTGWLKKNTAGGSSAAEWVEMGDDETFDEGGEYISVIHIRVSDSYKAVFTSETEFEFYGHKFSSKSNGEPDSKVTLDVDGKGATVYLKHKFLSRSITNGEGKKEDVLAAYRIKAGTVIPEDKTIELSAGDLEEITSDTVLELGDRVIFGMTNGYKMFSEGGLTDTKTTVKIGTSKYTVWSVEEFRKSASDEYGKVEVAVCENVGSSGDDWNCSCGGVLFQWKTKHPVAEGGDDGGATSDSSATNDNGEQNSGNAASSATSETAEENTTTTLNYICSENQMANYLTAGGGIPVGTGWNAGSVAGVNSQVQNNLFQLFLSNTMGSRYNQQVTWSQYDAGTGVETVLGSGATFQMGQQYVSTVTISVPNGSSERFNASSSFKFGNHKLLGKPVISADGKTATVKVLHTVEAMDGNAVKLYFADTGEEITDDTQLQPGDLVRLSVADGYEYYILGGLRASGTDGVYIVEYCQSASGILGGIEILFYLADDPDGCGCGTMLYKHTVGNVGGYGQAVDLNQNGSSVKGAARSNTSVVSLGLVNGQTYSRGGAVGGTGDEGRLILWLLLSIGSAAGLAEIYLLENRRRAARRRKAMRRRTTQR